MKFILYTFDEGEVVVDASEILNVSANEEAGIDVEVEHDLYHCLSMSPQEAC